MRGDPARLLPEQPAELALVRREDRGRRAIERLELVQAVGVDDGRRSVSASKPADELLRSPRRARAERERAGALDASNTSSSGRLTASSRRVSSTGSDSAGAATAT